jgi:hypothetical protein
VPPEITREDWLSWSGRVPGTQTPPRVDPQLWLQLARRAGLNR